MGCIYAGLQVSFANPTYTRTELRHVLGVLNPKLVLTSSPFFKRLAVEARVEPRRLILMDTETTSGPIWVERVMVSRDEARKAGDGAAARPAPRPTAEQLAASTAFLPWSSGTTGLPKAIEITQRNVVAMIAQLNAVPGAFRLGGRYLAVAPFFHAIGLIASVCHNLVNHNRVYILSPFNPIDFCHTVREKRITVSTTVPPMLQAVVNCPAASPEAFRSVEWMGCGAAPLSAELQLKIQEKLGMLVVQGHGQTETTVGAFGLQPGCKEGTIGWPQPGIEARLVDDNGRDVTPGERGELLLCGPNITKGYYLNPSANRGTFTHDGWMKTGDVALMDESGQFSIVDRKKELIKYKGFQVAPAELEAILLQHPRVLSAAVVGVWSEAAATELPRAYVSLLPTEGGVRREGDEAQAIAEWVKGKVSNAKRLHGGVRIVEAVPVSPSGKLLRKEIRKWVEREEQEAKGEASEAAAIGSRLAEAPSTEMKAKL